MKLTGNNNSIKSQLESDHHEAITEQMKRNFTITTTGTPTSCVRSDNCLLTQNSGPQTSSKKRYLSRCSFTHSFQSVIRTILQTTVNLFKVFI